MTQENKKLLLVDLCARLPYYTEFYSNVADGNWAILTPVVISNLMSATDKLVIKPYLRPMSSMTEEEKMESLNFAWKDDYDRLASYDENIPKYIDWLNAHRFDYRGLIERGLAIAVTEENNPYKE